jgi:hypothetical protein
MMTGVRAGYNFAPLKGDWMFNQSTAAGGPDIGITGPYVQFMIGGCNKAGVCLKAACGCAVPVYNVTRVEAQTS